jgi:hypothetical protein
MVDLFFGIKIYAGEKLNEFLKFEVKQEIEIKMKQILEKCI